MRGRSGLALVCLALACLALAAALLAGCSPRIEIFGLGDREALEERTLRGEGADKVLYLPVRGVISTSPRGMLFTSRPSLMQEVAARLDKAAEDEQVKAVVLAIDSPGGSVAASDILHQRVSRHREETGQAVVALLMDVAASGGYYTAVACERIIALPATITGSIGTIFIRPEISGLMDKVGVRAEVTKSGPLKDMGSPLRASTSEERDILQSMMDDYNRRFLDAVQRGRGLDDAALARAADGRILTAGQALEAGLVDELGYPEDAFEAAKELAGLEQATLVVYRRGEAPDDTMYNLSARAEAGSLVLPGLADFLAVPRTGFYYLWAPELADY